MEQKICPDCRKPMQPIVCINNPPNSEWYCRPCHFSLSMNFEEFRAIMAAAQAVRQTAPRPAGRA